MELGMSDPKQGVPSRASEGVSKDNDNRVSETHSGMLPLRPRSDSKSTSSPHPSPLSQSTSAGVSDANHGPSAPEVHTEPRQSAMDFPVDIKQEADIASLSPTAASKQPSDGQALESGSVAAAGNEREPDSVPVVASPMLSGNDSPDARLKKDYHKDKTGERGTNSDKEYKSSGDESDSRGRQKSREKKHYRKDSNISASDTDGTSANETSTGKKPPRKLKTFEPLREKQESKFVLDFREVMCS